MEKLYGELIIYSYPPKSSEIPSIYSLYMRCEPPSRLSFGNILRD